MYDPLGLAEEGRGVTQQVVMIFAVTNELTKGVGALLMPAAYQELTWLQRELKEDSRKTDEMCSNVEKQREGFYGSAGQVCCFWVKRRRRYRASSCCGQ